MALLLYAATAIVLLAIMHRWVCRLSLATAVFLFLIPFPFVGNALVLGRIYAPIDRIYQDEPLRSIRDRMGIGDPHNPATSDIYAQMIPWREAVRQSYARGEWPLWNPSILCGDVLAAAAQPAAFSPFTLIALLLPAALSFTFTTAIAFLVAGAGAFAFARELGCRESSAAIAAAGFAYCTGMAMYILWPMGFCWALFPFVLAGAHRAATQPSIHSWALLTAGFTLLLLAGHDESALHIVSLSAAYGVFAACRARRNPSPAIAVALAAGGCALLLCAIQLLPHLDAAPESEEYSIRMAFRGNALYESPPQVLASLATNFFPSLYLRKWSDPNLGALKAESAAVGSLILALAVYALWRVRSATTWFFGAMLLVCLAAHASWKPIGIVFSRIPLFNMTLNDRLAFGAAFAFVVLAAIGAEEIARREDRRAAALTMLAVLVVLAGGLLLITRSFVIDSGPVDWGRYKVAAELGFLAVGMLILLFRVPVRAALPILVALVCLQRAISDGGVHHAFPRRAAYPRTPVFAPLANAQRPFRVTGLGWSFIPNMSALYGVEDPRGYEAMTFRRLHRTYLLWSIGQPVFFNRIDDLTRPFISLMNVRFTFADAKAGVPQGWRQVARDGNAVLLENASPLPRAFVPRSVSLGPDRSYTIYELGQMNDFSESATIEADVAPYTRVNGPGTVRIVRYEPRGEYELDADMKGDGWVVVTSANWKGWRAYVDGHRVRTQYANIAFIGIHTPPGRHAIRLVYLPQAFVTGRVVSFGMLLGILAFAVIRSRTVSQSHSRTAGLP